MLEACGVPVERLWGGRPILAPRGEGWEGGHAYNAACVRLGPTDEALIRELLGGGRAVPARGIVAVLYRAQPRYSPGFHAPRSSIGLALFTPEMELLGRLPEPVIRPTDDPDGFDHNGVEDPRVTRIGDTFYLVYCGYTARAGGDAVCVCMARSRDLRHWEKLGPARGDVNGWPNKDGVLLPEPIGGEYFLLHRPMVGRPARFCIELATSDSPTGVWRNRGKILCAPQHDDCRHAWVGAGSVPISLGDGRYLALYHTGHRMKDGCREYSADAAILDFRRFSPEHPAAVTTAILEHLLVPETKWERSASPARNDALHCVFPCGSFEEEGQITMVYGGGDIYTLAARVRKNALLERLQGEPGAVCA